MPWGQLCRVFKLCAIELCNLLLLGWSCCMAQPVSAKAAIHARRRCVCKAMVATVRDRPMAGLAFIVSAIALIGSGAFPLIIEKLKENEGN